MDQTLCILGCGNLGTPILSGILSSKADTNPGHSITKIIAIVHSEASEKRLSDTFAKDIHTGTVTISRGQNVQDVQNSTIILLAVDPSQVQNTLQEPGLAQALHGKLLISVVAGWSRENLENLINNNNSNTHNDATQNETASQENKTWFLRTLPNIAAQVSQSLTAIEAPGSNFPPHHMALATAIFSQIGKVVHVPPRLMAATTAVGGSTPAFWAIACDAFIDAAVAVGMPRAMAQEQIYQSMRGTAEMLQRGIHPGVLRDQGTSPEGCTIGGVMVLEEMGVRGALGRALRESVTIARAMGSGEENLHVNDTRRL